MSLGAILSRQEAEDAKTCFEKYDSNRVGLNYVKWCFSFNRVVELVELTKMLKELGQLPNDDDLFELVLKLNLDASGQLTFEQFISLIEMNKQELHGQSDDQGLVEAFGLPFFS
jgi:hypothetical protein